MRRRLLSVAAVGALALGGSVVVAGTPADAATGAGAATGRYVAVTPTRLLDTRVPIGVKTKATVPSRGRVTFPLPSALSAATAVVLNITATGTTATGYVTAYGGGTAQPGVSNLNYVKGQTVPNLAVVKLGTARSVTLYNAGGPVNLFADISGYYLPNSTVAAPPSAQDQGGFVALPPARLVDTRAGTKPTQIPAHTARTFALAGIPTDASAVLANVTETRDKAGGYLTAYAGSTAAGVSPLPPTSTVNFPANRTVPNLALIPLGDGSVINVYNGSADPTDVIVDVAGYTVEGDPTVAGGTGVLHPSRLLAAHAVGKGSTYSLKVAGAGGVPLTGVSAVVLNVTVTKPAAGGYLSVSTSTAKPSFSNLNFAAGETIANLVQARVSSTGTVTFYNGAAGTVYVLADVLGYVPSVSVTPPSVGVSRYLADLTGNLANDQATMQAHGCADAASGTDVVLLDVGAQSYRGPTLSTADPGVALANTAPTVRLTYPDLVTDVQAYLQGFTTACGAPASVRIAVGTNNSGNFTDSSDPTNPVYPATTRGTDWFTEVVAPLQKVAPIGVSVIGADDIENGDPDGDGFDNSVTRAQQWEAAWFKATSTTLVYNGDAGGCPTTYGTNGACNDGWTQAEIYGLARGTGSYAGKVQVLPQIYTAAQAAQWANIDRVGGKQLTFAGSLTQYGVTHAPNTATAGWADLRHALSTERSAVPTLRAIDLTQGASGAATAELSTAVTR